MKDINQQHKLFDRLKSKGFSRNSMKGVDMFYKYSEETDPTNILYVFTDVSDRVQTLEFDSPRDMDMYIKKLRVTPPYTA